MKNKLIVAIATATLLTIATVAMASSGITLISFEDSTDCTDVFFNVEEDFSFDFNISEKIEFPTQPAFELVEEEISFNDFTEESITTLSNYIETLSIDTELQKQFKNEFINTAVDYSMTSDEIDFVNSLILEDYDISLVLDIYKFLRQTDSDISIIPEIYHAGEKNSDEKFWIYNAYDQIFNRTDDMLSVEEVANYIAEGITPEEIAGAYELSFAGVKTTKQMLNERINGASWNTIVSTFVSDNPQTIANAPEMSISEIMLYRSHSIKTRNDFADMITIENNAVSLKEDILLEANDALAFKYDLMKKFDAEAPVSKASAHTNDDSVLNNTPITITPEEYIFEEDYIPLEDPEVE